VRSLRGQPQPYLSLLIVRRSANRSSQSAD
jgi:hypothetical protein